MRKARLKSKRKNVERLENRYLLAADVIAGHDLGIYSTNEDQQLVIESPGILANDSCIECEGPLSAQLKTGPAKGEVSVGADGSFVYTPDLNFSGLDTFIYEVSADDDSDLGLVTVHVNPVNDAPMAADDEASGDEDTVISGNVLDNDSDADGDTLTASLVDDPVNGSVVLNDDGSFEYTPNPEFQGADSFTYVANDGQADSETATVLITVIPLNSAPTAVADEASGDEDTVISGNVLDNDSDVDGDTLTASLVDDPVNGSVVLNDDGSFEYTPNPDFHGADSFTYVANDGLADSAVTAVSITVNPVNDAPVAVDDALVYSTSEDTPLSVDAGNGVLSNDVDADGDELTATLLDSPAVGDLVLNSDGSFEYTPEANFNGVVAFTYVANDGQADSNVATVSITVDPVNDAPVAVADEASGDEDTVISGNVLDNDSDVDGDTLTASLVDDPVNGSVVLNDDGSFEYTPNPDFHGADSFTYVANDGQADSDVTTVSITVILVNNAPVAVADEASGDEDTVISGNVLDNDSDEDGDTLTASLVDDPVNGSVVLNDDGSFEYTPNPDFHGADSFTYVANDGLADSAVTAVSITVNPVNDAPVAVADEASGDEDTVISGNVLDNDSDVDGDTLTASLVDDPVNGSVVLNDDGSFEYTPNPDFHGADSFTYVANDGLADSDVATVSITVNPVNDAPVAVADEASGDEGTVISGNVLDNDSDVDGDTLAASLVDDPVNGSVVLNDDGSFEYTPNPEFQGADSFTYVANDGQADSDVTTVSITVILVNNAPVAVADEASGDEDTVISGNVLDNDSDVDGDTLTASLVDDPVNGSVVLNDDGSFEYTPNPDFHGADSFTYVANDGLADSAVTAVSITVNPVNDAPVAVDDALVYSTSEDTPLSVDAGNGVLSNDVDADGDELTATLLDSPAVGDLVLNSDGSFEYTPEANFNGVVAFTYVANDGQADSNVATVSITVDPVNDAPVAVADEASGDEDTVISGNVLDNDSDVDGDTLTASLVDDPVNGSVVLNDDGSFEYTPNPEFQGADSFTYVANDGQADSAVTTVSITVNPVNDAPVAVADEASGDEDTVISGNVLDNDSDEDGDTLTASLVDDPANGSVVLNDDGSFEYTPNPDFQGADSFTYVANDGLADSDVATVSITVNPVNDAPVAVADEASGDEDTVISGNVLDNDSDVDGDTLTASLVDDPVNGSVVLNDDGSFEYTPNPDFQGADSFTYVANDGLADSDVATVSITVNPVNDAPVAVADEASGDEGTVISGNVLDNDSDVDGDTLTASLVDDPVNGSVVLNDDGSFEYTPNPDFQGADSFTYVANDGQADSAVTTVSITVNPVNDAPVAVADEASGDEDTVISGNVLDNDSDVDGDTLTASLVDDPVNGSVVLNDDGSFEYTPNPDFHGADSFTYVAQDGQADSAVTTVSITVNPVNDAPVAVADEASGDEDTVISGNVLDNDSDVDGDTLAASLVDDPVNGSVVLNDDGSFEYTPNPDFQGADSFTYVANDGQADSAVTTVSITVNPINDAPVAVADEASGDEDTVISGNVLDNDSDVDGDTLTASLVDDPVNGSVVLNDDGSFEYTPNPDFQGADSFTYVANDGQADSAVTTVSITVDPVNDAPVAVDDEASGDEDTVVSGNVLDNDSDVDGDTLTASLVDDPVNGSVVLNDDGSFEYTPNPDFHGADSFTYLAHDGELDSSLATVAITIDSVNDAPVALHDLLSYEVFLGETLTIDALMGVLANDFDVDGDNLTAILDQSSIAGDLTLNEDGSFVYVPEVEGLFAFSYFANDGELDSNVAVVTISVRMPIEEVLSSVDQVFSEFASFDE